MFEVGREYRRRDIHNLYGGQMQGGISTPSSHKVIFLFTSYRGKEHGYTDGLQEDGIFLYSGEGQYGDMTFTRGNKHIRDHQAEGREIHVFKQTQKGFVRYMGRVRCVGYHFQSTSDTEGKVRQQIVFELKPEGEFLA